MTEIQKFYQQKTVFITGGTGFIGKTMIEKLLRCTDIARLYLLIREKRGADHSQRLQQLFNSRLFDRLRAEKAGWESRVRAVQGDIEKPMLGLSPQDQLTLINETEIVFHCAATVRFDEDLSKALTMNVSAVSFIISLSKKMKQLKSLVHVSTAYCHCQRPHIEERDYPPPMEPKSALSLLETLDTKILDNPTFTKMLIGERPNTYTFTKALAEELIMSEARELPVCIVRPSIVLSTWRDPMPGWVDNLNGPTGLFLIAGIGVMRTAVVHEDLMTDGVPVDTCANLTLAAAWRTGLEQRQGQPLTPRIYNYTSGNQVPLTWGEIYSTADLHLRQNPLEGMVWYPGGSFKHYHSVNRLYEMVLHELPARLTDLICTVFGKDPFAVRLCNKMQKGMRSLEYFTTHQWTWDTRNTEILANSLTAEDREIFYFQLDTLDWFSFIEQYILGTRKFVLKQDPATIPACRKKMYMLWLADRMVKLFIIYLLFKLFSLAFL